MVCGTFDLTDACFTTLCRAGLFISKAPRKSRASIANHLAVLTEESRYKEKSSRRSALINNEPAREMIERAMTMTEPRRSANRFDDITLGLDNRICERTAARQQSCHCRCKR